MGDAMIEAFLRSEEVDDATARRIEAYTGARRKRRQALARIERQAQLAQRVDPRALRGAFAQEFERPGPETRIGIGPHLDAEIAPVERFEEQLQGFRRGPSIGIAGRDQPGIAVA